MAKLGDLWADFRAGKPIRSKSAKVPYVQFSKDDPHYGGDCLYDHNDCYDQYFAIELDWMDADDWEIVPEPSRVADYLVETPYKRTDIEHYPPTYWQQSTHPIGSQPEGSVLVPGSEKEVTE